MPSRVQKRPVKKAASRGRKPRSSKQINAIAEAIATPTRPKASFETMPPEVKDMIYKLLIPKGTVTPLESHRPMLPRRVKGFCLASKAIYRGLVDTYYFQVRISASNYARF